jgi:hypothetical protein
MHSVIRKQGKVAATPKGRHGGVWSGVGEFCLFTVGLLLKRLLPKVGYAICIL